MTTCTHGKEDHESCVRCAMVGQVGGFCIHGVAMERNCSRCGSAVLEGPPLGRVETEDSADDAIEAAKLAERARCRAIVARLFGSDWNGGEALRLIDGG